MKDTDILFIIRKIFDDYDEKNGAMQKIDYTQRAEKIIHTWIESMSKEGLTTWLICEFHRLVCEDEWIPINDPKGGISGFAKAGEYRNIVASAPSYLKKGAKRLFSLPHEISQKMENIVSIMNKILASNIPKELMKENILSFAVELSTIHPFPNQNWRVILSLVELLAYQCKLEPFHISYINKINPSLLINSIEQVIVFNTINPILHVLNLYEHKLTPNGLRYGNNITEYGKKYFNFDYDNFEIDEATLFSSVKPFYFSSIDSIFKTEEVKPKSIIDATANVGGDTLNFIRMFPSANICAIEKEHNIFVKLENNIKNIDSILAINVHGNISTVNESAVKYFEQKHYAEMIYFDPPWGGSKYQLCTSFDLFLDNIPIGKIINDILSLKRAQLVIIKLPINANLDGILCHISPNLNISAKLYDVTHSITNTIDYRFLFIRLSKIFEIE